MAPNVLAERVSGSFVATFQKGGVRSHDAVHQLLALREHARHHDGNRNGGRQRVYRLLHPLAHRHRQSPPDVRLDLGQSGTGRLDVDSAGEQSGGVAVFDNDLKAVVLGLELFHFLLRSLDQHGGLPQLRAFILSQVLHVHQFHMNLLELLLLRGNLGVHLAKTVAKRSLGLGSRPLVVVSLLCQLSLEFLNPLFNLLKPLVGNNVCRA